MTFSHLPFSLRQLQYALAVRETGGFGRAAELCGVAQPSLSAQVAKLEDSLGVQLFERHARRVLVTEAGARLLDEMAAALAAAERVQALAAAEAEPYAHTLRVGVIPTVAPYLLPGAARALAEQAPELRVHWLELQTPACEAQLASGQLDAMLIADPPTQPSVDHLKLGWEPFVAVVPEGLGLTGRVDLDALVEHELLLLEDGHCLRDHTLAVCSERGVQESPYRATSLVTLVQMVGAGLGVSVLPRSAVAVEAARAPVRALPFRDHGVGRTLRLGWRARSPHTRLIRELARVLRGVWAD